jgi:hypothetical protein
MLKWILIAIGALVVLVLVLWVVGRMLPREHLATSRARFGQSAETIWAAITDHASMSGWRNGMKQVVRGADQGGKPVWIETSSFGEIPLRVEEAVPPERYVLAIASDALPFGGTWTYEIEPAAGGSQLSITENGFVEPALFRVMTRYVFGYHATLDQYLRDLGKKFGETVQPEHAP